MLLDIPEERGGANMDKRWGNPRDCHFPLFPFIQPMPLPCMGLTYLVMWVGALGVMLGYKFRTSAAMFSATYWYILLIEKSFWNNHSYLFGLVGLLLVSTQANRYLSVDAYLDPSINDQPVPRWNYFVLKYQFFILYFMAGLKKGSVEWLSGYAMTNLSNHWVFNPFKLFLTTEQTDYLIVHWFTFLFDLTIAFWMMWDRTRNVAMLFCAAFHLMNTRLFRIGMFPWVCLATMPLFYSANWPKLVASAMKKQSYYITYLCTRTHIQLPNNDRDDISKTLFPPKEDTNNSNDVNVSRCLENDNSDIEHKANEPNYEDYNPSKDITTNTDTRKRHMVTWWIIIYMTIQGFLPFSHFITKGYNNWTNGLYGYSWDMMVNSWDTILTVVKVVDNENNKEYYLEPDAWTPNDRWSKHGDMVYQYARCIERNILDEIDMQQHDKSWNDDTNNELRRRFKSKTNDNISKNISIYIDVWCSMNGRFQQRMFNPKVDLLKANWSPFQQVSWLMPLLTDHTHWRELLNEIRTDIYSWNNYTNVLFAADFPGHHLQNYIAPELTNVTLTVLDGLVVFEPALLHTKYKSLNDGYSIRMKTDESVPVEPGYFHKVHTVGDVPACYMYTFMNETNAEAKEELFGTANEKLPIWKEFRTRANNMGMFFKLIRDTMLNLVFNMPMLVRQKNN